MKNHSKYAAYAIALNHHCIDGKPFTVCIYSNYETRNDAQQGINRFMKTYEGSFVEVIKTWIE